MIKLENPENMQVNYYARPLFYQVTILASNVALAHFLPLLFTSKEC